jgi:plastocyanin
MLQHARNLHHRGFAVLALAAGMLAAPLASLTGALAADGTDIAIEIKDHKFSPAEIKVPAGKPLKITVKNSDATAEEFESHPLGVEKVIAGNSTVTVRIRPLDKGTYKFIGEYHEATAKGTLIAE